MTASGVRSAKAKSTVPPVGMSPKILSCLIQLMLLAQSPCQLRPCRWAMLNDPALIGFLFQNLSDP